MSFRRHVPVPSLDGRLCLVTGAASGIGRATAEAAARAGARLVLTDVNAEQLDEAAAAIGDRVVLRRALDITDPAAVRGLADDTHAAHGSADVVMNVAGIATWGPVERLTHEQWRRTVDVDLMGPIHVIESFVPEMVRAGRGGQLVNVASAAALVGLPWHAPYSAAKFGLRGVSEVLRFDLRRHGIGVTLVCPGAVATPIVHSVDVAGVDRERMMASGLTQRFLRHARTPEYVAERILEGVTRNRYLVHTATDVRLMSAAQKFTPHIYAGVMRTMNNVFVRQMEKLGESGQAAREAH